MKKACMIFILAVVLGIFFGIAADPPAQAEEASKTISGKVTSVAYGAWTPFGRRRSTVVVEDSKGKVHTIFIGRNTVYIPHRVPVVGDKVSVVCVDQKGLWAGVSVTYK